MYHLDTNIVIAFLNGVPSMLGRFNAHRGQMMISSLVWAELLFGARSSGKVEQNLERLARLEPLLPIIDFDASAAEAYSPIRLGLKRKGRPTGDIDMLIASVAIAEGATLVTHNTKHFDQIDGLQIEDWLA